MFSELAICHISWHMTLLTDLLNVMWLSADKLRTPCFFYSHLDIDSAQFPGEAKKIWHAQINLNY